LQVTHKFFQFFWHCSRS